MDEKESSLKELFLLAKQKQQALEHGDPRSDGYTDSLRVAMKALEDCRDLINQVALYSTNEEVEDISTQDLQFLAVDYLLAELLLRSYGNDRLSQLRKASELLESFLTRLDQYELLSVAERKLYERYQHDRQGFSIISTNNAESRRNLKVARFQEEKALKNKMKVLRDQANSIMVDDEIARNLYLTELAFYVHQSFQSLDLVSQELSILSQMRQAAPSRSDTAEQDGRRNQAQNNGYSERLDGPNTVGGLGRRSGPILSPSGKPMQPFTLTSKRAELRNGVFRPDHSLPTMSIDEYLEEEKRRGGIIDGGGNANAPQPEPDEDNMDLVDAATMKARDWDEFVEANPKGAGNTLNRG